MMLLKIILLNGQEYSLSCEENEWQYLIHFGSKNDVDNRFIISNTLLDMSNSQYVLDFFNETRDIPYEQVETIQLFVNGIQVFDSYNLGYFYKEMYIEYKYNSNMVQISTADRGLIYQFILRRNVLKETNNENN